MPTYQLMAAANLIDTGPQTAATVVMPVVDSDGNPLSDGIEISISFGDNIMTLTFTGMFRNTPPTSASAGQVLNFHYSVNTNSWWNA